MQDNRVEIGGLLIGMRSKNRYSVQDVTIPCRMKNPSRVSFVLDIEAHMMQAAKLMRQRCNGAEVIGSWHTHICDRDFSKSDQAANLAAAREFGETCSLLVVTGTTRWEYKAICIDKRCKERRLSIIRGYG